jgi:hypothetical protein
MARKTKAQLQAEKARKEEINDLISVMSTEYGRRFMWRQLGAAGIFHECFNAESEGARRLGLATLRELMTICPGLYLTMQKEALDAETLARIQKEQDKGEENNDAE